MIRKARRSGATPNAPRVSGDRADNPDVSLASKFWDDVWDFSNEDGNPAVGSHDKADILVLQNAGRRSVH